MTANFKQFKELVEKKFGSLSNFSFVLTGGFMTFQGLRNINEFDKIAWLIKKANDTDFKIEDVEITDFDRKAILARMDYFLFEEDYKNVSVVLKKKGISHFYYSAVIHGRSKRKNLAFERLWNKLGL